MFYRRKILLAMLELFGNDLHNTDFQKYLFLFTKFQEMNFQKSAFDFVPYKFGAFSFQSHYDKRAMIKDGQLVESIRWIKNDAKTYLPELKPNDRELMLKFKSGFGELKGKDLLKYVYENFPYYASKSEIAPRIMSKEELKLIEDYQIYDQSNSIFTIGHEGKTVEDFVNQLIKNNIHIVIDIRKYTSSMKRGFARKELKEVLKKFGIKYVHLPTLDLDPKKRKQLKTLEDHQALFKDYAENDLQNNPQDTELILQLVNAGKRVALMCFSADINYCHRTIIADFIKERSDCDLEVKNI